MISCRVLFDTQKEYLSELLHYFFISEAAFQKLLEGTMLFQDIIFPQFEMLRQYIHQMNLHVCMY